MNFAVIILLFLILFFLSMVKFSILNLHFVDYIKVFIEIKKRGFDLSEEFDMEDDSSLKWEKRSDIFKLLLKDLNCYVSSIEFLSFLIFSLLLILTFRWIFLHSIFLLFPFILLIYMVREVFPQFFLKSRYRNFLISILPFFEIITPFCKIFRRKSGILDFDFLVSTNFQAVVEIFRILGVNVDVRKLKKVDSILELFERKIKKIMISRNDMVYVTERATLDEVKEKMIENQLSRIPVVNPESWEIKGVVYIRNFLRVYNEEIGKKQIYLVQEIFSPPFFVHESSTIMNVLEKMKTYGMQMAFVVNEHSEVMGIVTSEDIFEEIVGEIKDEDQREKRKFLKIGKKKYIIDADYEIDEFEKVFGEIEEEDITEDIKTIGGVVINSFGRIPEVGEEIDISRFHFKVLDSDQRKINRLEFEIIK